MSPRHPQVQAAALVQQRGPDRLDRRVDLAQRPVDQGRRGVVADDVRGQRRPSEGLDAVHAGPLSRVGHPAPQLECPLIVAEGLGVGVQLFGLHGRPH
jgi:hypothetical protein